VEILRFASFPNMSLPSNDSLALLFQQLQWMARRRASNCTIQVFR